MLNLSAGQTKPPCCACVVISRRRTSFGNQTRSWARTAAGWSWRQVWHFHYSVNYNLHAPGDPLLARDRVALLLLDTDASGLMVPNPNFVGAVLGRFERTEPLMLLCKVGARSAHACQILADQGYEKLANVVGGMHGPGGWMQEGLPLES